MQTRRSQNLIGSLPWFRLALPFAVILTCSPSFKASAAEVGNKPILAGPAISKPAKPCAWEIKVSRHDRDPKDPVQISSVKFLNSNAFAIETVALVSGETFQTWSANGNRYCPTGNPNVLRLAPAKEDSVDSGTDPQLSEFDWINASNFRGNVTINGENCMFFAKGEAFDALLAAAADAANARAYGTSQASKTAPGQKPKGAEAPQAQKWPAGPIGGLPLQPGIQAAAILESSRAPKYLQNGTEIRTYEFSTPTPEETKVPKKLKDAMDYYTPKKTIQRRVL